MSFKFFNKASAAVMAAAMLMNGTAVLNTGTAFAAGTKYEFEDAKVTGTISVEDNADASGGKSLRMENDGSISVDFEVEKAGIYNISIYCGGIGGAKQQNLSINGVTQGALGIPESDGFEAVKVSSVKLNEGKNNLLIEKSWGWSNFDYMVIEDASSTPIVATQTTPVDPKATAETKNLMSYFASVYGEHIISGQQEIYSGGPHGLEQEFEYLNDLTGHYPAIRGFDYGNFCCPAFGSPDGSTDRIIDWVKNKNGIATASFHLNVPTDMSSYNIGDRIDWGQTTYTEKTDFSPSKAIVEGTKENQYYMQALETLAAEFKKLEAEGIPVLWRPLHEAEGGGGEEGSWFWWGREGSKAYKDLWIFTYKTLTEDFGCHNLIWEWNSYNFTTSADWYPGDEYVDIIGYDKYNCTKYLAENDWNASYEHDDSAISSTFYGIMEKYNNAKMVAMAENDCFSTVENLTTERAGWLYFCTWYDGGSDNINFLSNPLFNTEK
ncbi:MAG: glycoside hydrolase, partial [Ruminococcus sp.]|nr:glycoside hydrolase [Ruminococcus sp.]